MTVFSVAGRGSTLPFDFAHGSTFAHRPERSRTDGPELVEGLTAVSLSNGRRDSSAPKTPVGTPALQPSSSVYSAVLNNRPQTPSRLLLQLTRYTKLLEKGKLVLLDGEDIIRQSKNSRARVDPWILAPRIPYRKAPSGLRGWALWGGGTMVIYCKHCGAALLVDDACMPTSTFGVKCYRCQNLSVVEPPLLPSPKTPATPSKPAAWLGRPPAAATASVGLLGAAASPARSAAGAATATVAAEHQIEVRLAPSRTHTLQRTLLFSALSNAECLMVESRLKHREFAPFQTIVREGGPGDSMFFLKAGTAEVRKRDPITGFDFLLAELKANSCFGEMTLLTGKPRPASVIAIELTTCGVLEQSDFEDLLLSNPKIGLALNRVLAERIDEFNHRAGIESVNLTRLQLDPRVLKLLPQEMLLQHKILPIAYAHNRITLAMVNPTDLAALDDVRRVLRGVMIEPVEASQDDIERFMKTIYVELLRKEEEKKAAAKEQAVALMKSVAGDKAAGEVEKLIAQGDRTENILDSLQCEALVSFQVDETPQPADNVTELSAYAEDASVVRLANSILALAIKKGASDIHVEPQENQVAVRFRIDGKLQQAQVLPKEFQLGLISRFKILAKLDLAEKRLPQDGRISVRTDERAIEFRVSTIPSKWGEKACLRIREKSSAPLALDKLILHPEALALVREMIAQPYGIIYVTGPGGSGKTTTLYSALAELNDPDVNISAAEDPIEYDLPRVNQIQVNKEIGLDFANIVRAFLRQDPDVILVGETQDTETAKIAVEAALAGHLVLTALHANDAPSAFARLGEMGIEPFLLSSSTVGVIAQRLTRRLCENCKQAYPPDDLALKYLRLEPDPTLTFYRKSGCDRCSMIGYNGRVGVYEVLRVNSQLRRALARGVAAEAIAKAAAQNGMKTLKDYSVWLLKNGWTTVDEVIRVLSVCG